MVKCSVYLNRLVFVMAYTLPILGDKVVLTSTDYDWQQVEEAVVVQCSDCSNKQVRVDCKYMLKR